MPRIQIEISEDVWERARRFVPEDRIPDLIGLALEEWVSWSDGSSRPMSISELETQRIFGIYDRLLVDDIPSADHLGELLRLPMGRARYIAQSLAYRHGNLIRERQARVILGALENGRWSEAGDNCVVVIDRNCQALMDRTISGLAAEDKLSSLVQGTSTMQGVRYDLGPGHHETLVETFRGYLGGQ
jgi:hypothetical protein